MGEQEAMWWVPFVAAIGGALVGGFLTIIGGIVVERRAASERRIEALRDKQDRWRMEAARAAEAAYSVIQHAIPDLMATDDYDLRSERIDTLDEAFLLADRQLMVLSLSRPLGTTPAALKADALRPVLRGTKNATAIHGFNGAVEYSAALEANQQARTALEQFAEAIRALEPDA